MRAEKADDTEARGRGESGEMAFRVQQFSSDRGCFVCRFYTSGLKAVPSTLATTTQTHIYI